ncbi:hypothetical protein JTE90_002321 [Oedothorax gibbosus]|uniref:Uncharacterized protein n=1 Tax=Oedothorax gibbosus TaxID=931172 RepID=A0AAV6UJK4_9ARAC|nr:hypothetical protein JTE90_002321 [Oedothorax gibbosus]
MRNLMEERMLPFHETCSYINRFPSSRLHAFVWAGGTPFRAHESLSGEGSSLIWIMPPSEQAGDKKTVTDLCEIWPVARCCTAKLHTAQRLMVQKAASTH